MSDSSRALSRPEASAAVEPAGWRLLFRALAASVPVAGLDAALAVVAAARSAAGDSADGHLRVDLRADRVELQVTDFARGVVSELDATLAGRITEAVQATGHRIAPASGTRPVQMIEIAIDALDIPAVRPFWKAILDFEDAPGDGYGIAIVDPAGQLPSVWFQQMDAPRPQRNRIHFDLDVAHDDAPRRIQAALDAGGVMVSDAGARAFWVLADPEGNEVCICTWQDRD